MSRNSIEELTSDTRSPSTTRSSSTRTELRWKDEKPRELKDRADHWKYKMKQNYHEEKAKHAIMRKDSFLHYLLFFVILAVILYLVFYFFKFSFVQNKDLTGSPTGEVNQGKAVGWAIVLSLIIVALVYLLMVPKERW